MAPFYRRILAVPRQSAPNKRFARHSGEERKPHLLELAKMGEHRVILLEAFTEPKSWIEYEMIALDSSERRGLGPLAEIPFHKQNRIADGRKRAPLLGAAARMHEHGSDFQLGQRFGHLRIPTESTDIVHDLSALLDGCARYAGFVGVDADDGLRTKLLQVADHGQNAFPFLFL